MVKTAWRTWWTDPPLKIFWTLYLLTLQKVWYEIQIYKKLNKNFLWYDYKNLADSNFFLFFEKSFRIAQMMFILVCDFLFTATQKYVVCNSYTLFYLRVWLSVKPIAFGIRLCLLMLLECLSTFLTRDDNVYIVYYTI